MKKLRKPILIALTVLALVALYLASQNLSRPRIATESLTGLGNTYTSRPTFYRMNLFSGNFSQMEDTDWGATMYFRWDTLNPTRGDGNPYSVGYNWAPIDNWLAGQDWQTQLNDGTLVDPPVVLVVLLQRTMGTDDPEYSATSTIEYVDCTPAWVYGDIPLSSLETLTSGGKTETCREFVSRSQTIGGVTTTYYTAVPAYDKSAWRSALKNFVTAFGARYNGDSRIAGIVISSGIDGEMHTTKTGYPDPGWSVYTGFTSLYTSTDANSSILYWFRNAFPDKALYLGTNPSEIGCEGQTALWGANGLFKYPVLNIGFKNCGLNQSFGGASSLIIPDSDCKGACGYTNFWRSYDTIKVYSNTLPIWLETERDLQYYDAVSKTYGDIKLPSQCTSSSYINAYWSTVLALSQHPDGIDLHNGYFVCEPTIKYRGTDTGLYDWGVYYVGRGVTTTDRVWTVFHDEVAAPNDASCVTDMRGDYTYWLTRSTAQDTKSKKVLRASLPTAAQAQPYSYVARQFSETLSLNIDNSWSYVNMMPKSAGGLGAFYIRLIYLDRGTDTIAVQYKNNAGSTVTLSQRKTGTNLFVERVWRVEDGKFAGGFTGSNDIVINAETAGSDPDEIVHLLEVIYEYAAPGPSATPTRTPTGPTKTPTRTVTSTPTATPNLTASITPTPTVTPIATVGGNTPTPGTDQWLILPEQDTTLHSWYPTTALGTNDTLTVYGEAGAAAVYRFDVSELADATITSAKLSLYVTGRSNTRTLSVGAHALSVPFTAAATWQIRKASTVWSTAGALGSADWNSTAESTVLLGTINQWYEWDVTATLQAAVNTPDSEAGYELAKIKLYAGAGTGSVGYYIASMENANEGLLPRLLVRFSFPTPTPTSASITKTFTPTPSYTPTATVPTATTAPSVTNTYTPTPSYTATNTPVSTPITADVTITPDVDTYIEASAVTSTHATDALLYVRNTNGAAALFRFDVSSLAAGLSSIDNVRLYALTRRREGSSTLTISVHKMKRWVFSTASWNYYQSSSAWATAGAMGSTDWESTAADSLDWNLTGQWASWDVTAEVVAAAATTNKVINLKLYTSDTDTEAFWFASNDNSDTNVRPYLRVDYTAYTPTVTNTPTDTATPTDTVVPTATNTASITPTPTDTATPTATDTATPTYTDVPSSTPVPSATSTATWTAVPTRTSTTTHTPTSTATQTSTPQATPTPIGTVVWVDADTTINAYGALQNLSERTTLRVNGTNERHILIKFDLDDVDMESADVDAAYLRLYQNDMVSGSDNADETLTVSLYRLVRAWDAGTVSWLYADARTFWGYPGAASSTDRSLTAETTTTLSAIDGWWSFDVTNLVRDWLAGTYDNEGLIICANDNDWPTLEFVFASDEADDSYQPRLEVR